MAASGASSPGDMRRRHQSPRPKGRGMSLLPLSKAFADSLYLTRAQKTPKTFFAETSPSMAVAGLKTTVGLARRFPGTVFLMYYRLPLQP